MAAFKAALEGGYGIELDVHLLADGNLAVIHDSLLNRTTGQPGRVEDLTTAQLKDYRLEGTEETIPEFQDLLTLYNGKAPLIVELKPVDGNHAQLTETACKMLESYPGPYCLESFDPRCIQWLKKHRPDLIRGQLAYNYRKDRSDMPDYMRFLLTHYLLNFTCVPDFIAYRYSDRKSTVSNDLCRKVWKATAVSWTLKTKEEYDTAMAALAEMEEEEGPGMMLWIIIGAAAVVVLGAGAAVLIIVLKKKNKNVATDDVAGFVEIIDEGADAAAPEANTEE
jgi:glycerophosphoryl diester phosphodiesterase